MFIGEMKGEKEAEAPIGEKKVKKNLSNISCLMVWWAALLKRIDVKYNSNATFSSFF